MKAFKLILGLISFFLIFSFGKNKTTSFNSLNISGKYGICAYENSMPVHLELTLNEDSTFHYVDKTNAAKLIDTKGNWMMGNGTIVLQNYKSTYPIHSRWKIDNGNKCLKSKRGMTYYRLCNMNQCK